MSTLRTCAERRGCTIQIRTFEIIAKYIGQRHGITVAFDDGPARSDVKNKTIYLPNKMDESEVFTTLTVLIHEAAHIKYTTIIPEDLAKDMAFHEVLNAIEDARIDQKNFGILPNIHEFYNRYFKANYDKYKDKDLSKVSLDRIVLCNGILQIEGFPQYRYKRRDALEFDQKHDITEKMEDVIGYIERKNWKEVTKRVNEIVDLLKMERKPIQKKGSSTKGGGADEGIELLGFGKKGACSGQGTGTVTGFSELGELGLKELTKNKFKELLNIKEIRKIEDGDKIDTDNLTAYLTGDVEELLKEDIIEHRKRSKIMLVLDASGSMDGALLDSSSRKSTVGACCKELVNLLDEIQATEGLSVDWEVGVFTDDYYKCTKDNWENKYSRTSGGTNLLNAFNTAQKELLEDHEIDGNKIIILFSDGDVSSSEIVEMKKSILKYNQDVRCLIIGVGSDLDGSFTGEIIGEHNIIAKDCADIILMETVMECLA